MALVNILITHLKLAFSPLPHSVFHSLEFSESKEV